MTFRDLLAAFQGKRILVIGDVMLDEYIAGRATRISPEAPVMVLRKESVSSVPGGAANVAMNILAMGGQADLIGLTGDDASAQDLREGVAKLGISSEGLLADPSRPTTRKTRILADGAHQVLRIDEESTAAASQEVADRIQALALARIGAADAVLLSDYRKGALTSEMVRAFVEMAHAAGKPILGNAKPKSVAAYAGATLVSLNRPETAEALDMEFLSRDQARWAAREVARRYGVKNALATFGKDGFAAAGEDLPEPIFIPAPSVEVADPAGAGDTTIAAVALGVAAAGIQPVVFELAAQVSAAVVRHVGVAAPTEEDLKWIASRSAGVSSSVHEDQV